MNRITTPTLAWLLSATWLLIAGCSREAEIPGTLPPAQQGEVVTVPLNIDAWTLRPTDATSFPSPQTKAAATERIIATERTDNMLVELVATPDIPATRALSEDAIINFWLLQFDDFDGKKENAKLLKKAYYDSYADGMGVELIVQDKKQRLVVLANTFDPELGDRLPVGMTYQALLNTYKPLAGNGSSDLLTNGGNNIPMSGYDDVDIKDNSVGNQPLSITLRPTLAKLNVSVKNGNLVSPVAGSWNIQLCNVPNSYYLVPPWTDGVIFPAPGMPVSNYPEQAITFNESDFTAALTDCYLSPNMRGTVAGCTATQRPAKAPEGATYIKISGVANSTKFYTYTLHPSQNLTDRFDLLSNWSYTYRLTLYDNATANDGRVEVTDFNPSEVEYVGMYGGELKKDGAGVWQFTKKLYVQNTDEIDTAGKWATVDAPHYALAGAGVPNYTRNGRQITWNLNRGTGGSLTEFPAANACYKKSSNLTSAAALTWYLPAQDQLRAIWVSAHSTFDNTNWYIGYWSATETYSWEEFEPASYCFCIIFRVGDSNEYGWPIKPENKTRCVREL